MKRIGSLLQQPSTTAHNLSLAISSSSNVLSSSCSLLIPSSLSSYSSSSSSNRIPCAHFTTTTTATSIAFISPLRTSANHAASYLSRYTSPLSSSSTFQSSIFSSGPTRSFASASEREALRAKFSDKLKRYKATTPTRRHMVRVNHKDIYPGRPEKSLTVGLRKHGGRSRTTGRITVRHKGGGHKRLYRKIDFKRKHLDVVGTVVRLERDPNRSCYIALIQYPDGSKAYHLAPKDLLPNETVIASRTNMVPLRQGNAMPLEMIPIGSTIFNVELKLGKGGQLARSAGTRCILLDKENSKQGYALVQLQSMEQRYVHLKCMATLGEASNSLHHLEVLGKAGASRHLGIRPSVRGVAMNPVDHPHGGGGGKKKGIVSQSYSGVLAKGFPTRSKRKKFKYILQSRKGVLRRNAAQIEKDERSKESKRLAREREEERENGKND